MTASQSNDDARVKAVSTDPPPANLTTRPDFSVALRGSVHNTADLCRQLGLPGWTPPPALLEAGWRRWNTGLLRRLDGVFALVLRDSEDLFLYRDPSGLANLYVHTGQPGRLAFASHLGTLLQLPGVQARMARRSLHEYLRFLDISAPNTLYEDILAVEAGHCLRWSAGALAPAPLDDLPPAAAPHATFAQAVDELEGRLRANVATHLGRSSRPGAFLSGGIDSALLCAMAASDRQDTTAVTVGFDGAAFDEAPVAGRIAHHLGLRHEVLRFSRTQYLSAFDALMQQQEQPMADPATPATLLALQHCGGQFDALLDGTGADEALGMLPARHVRMAVAWTSRLPLRWRRGMVQQLRRHPRWAGQAPLLDFEHPADTMIRWNGFTRVEIEALCAEPVSFGHTQFYRRFQRHPRGAHFARYTDLLGGMPSDRLIQASLVSGVDMQFPFCSQSVDQFLRQLPTTFRYAPGQPKRILRTLLARHVPQAIWDVPKHGFSFPLHDFLAADRHALVRRHLCDGAWAFNAVLPAAPVAALAQRFIAGDQSLTFRIWALVVLGAWLAHRPGLH